MTKNQLNDAMRSLWEQHSEWTRMYIISEVAGLPDLPFTTRRLLRNPADFGALLAQFYTRAQSARFAELLRQHLLIASDLVKALKAGNRVVADQTRRKWYANAAELAKFMASINPFWPEREMRTMLFEHLSLVEAQATQRINKNYAADIATYDRAEQQALRMADMMTRGMIRQFPNKFT